MSFSSIIRYKGDTLRNPILVTRRDLIPTNFRFLDSAGGGVETFQRLPQYIAIPPDVPPKIVIGKEDLDVLVEEAPVPQGALAYFEISSIAINFSYDFVLNYWWTEAGPPNPNIGLGYAYYFVGTISRANYCSNYRPRIEYYTMNTENALELNLAGTELRNVSKVIFTFPNGVAKEARIIEGDIYDSSDPIINPSEIYRSMVMPEIETYEDEPEDEPEVDVIEEWFKRNRDRLETITFEQVASSDDGGYFSAMPFFVNQAWINRMNLDGIDLKKFRFYSTEYTTVDVVNNLLTLGLVSLFGDNRFSVTKYRYTPSTGGRTIWLAMSTGDAIDNGLTTAR